MWELRIRGGNFMDGIVAQLASEMLRVRSQGADMLIVARTLVDFRCTTTASLIVTNPDGAAHGILLVQHLRSLEIGRIAHRCFRAGRCV